MKIIGSQIDFVANILYAKRHPVDCGADKEELSKRLELARAYTQVIMQVTVSVSILLICFFLIYTNEDSELQKGCFGLIGTIVGYWLR